MNWMIAKCLPKACLQAFQVNMLNSIPLCMCVCVCVRVCVCVDIK